MTAAERAAETGDEQVGATQDSDSPIAIVLSGGGFRGAYQAGVLRALAEANISISALSGTSIGALNATVFAGHGAKQLYSEWEERGSTWRSLRPSALGVPIRSIALVLQLLFMWPFLIRHLYLRIKREDSGLYRFFDRLLSCRVSATQVNNDNWAFSPHVLAFMTVQMLVMVSAAIYLGDVRAPSWLWWATFVACGGLLLGFIWIGDVGTLFQPFWRLPSFLEIRFGGLLPSTETASNDPQVPTWVCASGLAHLCDWTDVRSCEYPFPVNSTGTAASGARAIARGDMSVALVCHIAPVYQRISALDSSTRLAFVRGSAAIPMGVVPSARLIGPAADGRKHKYLWDGGLVDNVPIYPLWMAGYRDILVIDIGVRPFQLSGMAKNLHWIHRIQFNWKHSDAISELTRRILIRRKGRKNAMATWNEVGRHLDAIESRQFASHPLPNVEILRIPDRRFMRLKTVVARRHEVKELLLIGYNDGLTYATTRRAGGAR